MNKQTFIDQMGREVHINYPPKRIISLVPSQAELLFDLGLANEVIGITRFCIHPQEQVKTIAKIGGTKKLLIDKIRQLEPDLIIGNKEENEKDQLETLMQEFPVWMSDITTLQDAYQMITGIGTITARYDQAQVLLNEIKQGFEKIKSSSVIKNRVAYLIWKNPYMVAAEDTFINEMLKLGGWENAFDLGRYPILSIEDLKNADPDLIFLSSEPYPFKEKHLNEFSAICPRARVIIVDGEMFSWYGSRLKKAGAYILSLQQIVNQN